MKEDGILNPWRRWGHRWGRFNSSSNANSNLISATIFICLVFFLVVVLVFRLYIEGGSDYESVVYSTASPGQGHHSLHANGSVASGPGRPIRRRRVAVCLVGGARAFELTGPSIKKYLLADLCSGNNWRRSRNNKDGRRDGGDDAGDELRRRRRQQQRSIRSSSGNHRDGRNDGGGGGYDAEDEAEYFNGGGDGSDDEEEAGGGYAGVDIFLHSPLDEDAYKLSILNDVLGIDNDIDRASSSPSSSSSSAAATTPTTAATATLSATTAATSTRRRLRPPRRRRNVCRLLRFRIFEPHDFNETIAAQVYTDWGSPRGVQGLLQYFNLVEGCAKMINQHQQEHSFFYDWIIRTRLDSYWNGFLLPLGNLDPTSYTIPMGGNFFGLNDRLGIGNWKTSEVALSRFSIIPTLYAHGLKELNSERGLQNLLAFNNVKIDAKEFPFCIVSHRCFAWPMNQPSMGVPIASISSKGPLNGAYCKPCRPVATGSKAHSMIVSLDMSYAGIGSNSSVDLCDPMANWEVDWKQYFDKVVDPDFAKMRRIMTNQSLEQCIEAYDILQKRVDIWDAPDSHLICKKGLGAQIFMEKNNT